MPFQNAIQKTYNCNSELQLFQMKFLNVILKTEQLQFFILNYIIAIPKSNYFK
jgi:hypothetical protein